MLKVVEVTSRKDLRRFVRFPDELYRGCPQYVPALHSDQIKSLTKVSTLSYCTRKMWLVEKDGKVAGRICGIINPHYNELYSLKRARFGWFDTVNDIEVARLLIGTAAAWAAEQGMTEIHGPLYYNTLGKQGMLVEGFDNIPPFNCIYNYSYYPSLIEALGFTKECDWVQYRMDINQPLPEKTKRLAALLRERYGLHNASLDVMKKDPAQVKAFFDMYSEGFATKVYNFIPFTEEEKQEEAAGTMRFVSDKVSCALQDKNGELAAFGICFPSMSKALQKARGRLFPFGWIHLLKALNDYETVDLMVCGAVGQWQGKGVSAVFYDDIYRKAAKMKSKWAISNPQIETNSAVNIWNSYIVEPYMRRRCYIAPVSLFL